MSYSEELFNQREATPEEKAWCKKMKALMKKKPKSIVLFCNGGMHVLCADSVEKQVKKGGSMPQPIKGVSTLGPADGGDF